MEDGMKILFQCDLKRCGDRCNAPDCEHTSDIRFARNFRRSDAISAYVEMGEPTDRYLHTVFCKVKDCKHRSGQLTVDGYGICLLKKRFVLIHAGTNGPMCESYEQEEAE